MDVCVQMPYYMCDSLRTTFGSWFIPSTKLDLEVKLRSSELAASSFPTELSYQPAIFIFADNVCVCACAKSGGHFRVFSPTAFHLIFECFSLNLELIDWSAWLAEIFLHTPSPPSPLTGEVTDLPFSVDAENINSGSYSLPSLWDLSLKKKLIGV